MWLRSYDPNYKNKVIYTDYFWPQLSWYLKIDVKGISTPDTGEYLNTELKNQKADYYISMVQTVNLKDYVKIKDFKTKFGNVAVYKRVNN